MYYVYRKADEKVVGWHCKAIEAHAALLVLGYARYAVGFTQLVG